MSKLSYPYLIKLKRFLDCEYPIRYVRNILGVSMECAVRASKGHSIVEPAANKIVEGLDRWDRGAN